MGVPFLGRIPMDPALGQACELGRSVFGDSPSAEASSHDSQQQNGATAMHGAGAQQVLASSGTLSSLRAIIDQLVRRMQTSSEAEALSSANQPQHAALLGSNGSEQQQQQTLRKGAPQPVVHSNGEVPLDPQLHYRIHLGI